MATSHLQPNCILIHYSEIGLKQGNRTFFQRVLKEHLRRKAPKGTIISLCEQRFVLKNKNMDGLLDSITSLSKIFGVAWLAPTFEIKPDLEIMKKIIQESGNELLADARTFRITASRADKSFRYTSQEIERIIGQAVVDNWRIKVNLSNPDKEIFVEVLPDSIFIYTDVHEGFRGLPVGSSGEVLSLFSGGIDSPVASWLILKRGCLPSYIHFHAFRSAGELQNSKVDKLLNTLAEYGLPFKAYFVPFFDFQTAILNIDPRYELLLFRRFIVKTSERLAKELGSEALVMGDNLGQVASQTLPYLALTDRDISIPILRPLITYTKEEIVDLAKDIGTYEASIEKYKDCCSIVSKHPTLAPDLKKLETFEQDIDLDAIVQKSLGAAEEKTIGK